jgi:glycine/D-amino acid oxidase-like deaminating enzyme/nitrite reductase/ring-hydroxylating ferredoxin subunit
MQSQSLWLDTAKLPEFPKLDGDKRADVLVVGGGITGLTSAYLLQKAGLSVVLVERGRLGQGETGHTTAHLTCATDLRLTDLVETFGKDHAQAAWDAGAEAISQIQTHVVELDISCELRQIPAYLVACADGDGAHEAERLRGEADLARELGFNAHYVNSAPFLGRPALLLANQAKFHPLKYLAGLAAAFRRLGGEIYEQTSVTDFEEKRAKADGGFSISYGQVIFATHVPLQGTRSTVPAALFQTKLAAYSTYAIQAKLPGHDRPEMLWWDTADPYHYLRIDRQADGDVLILGGSDHKTGQDDRPEGCYERLERLLHRFAPEATIEHRWSGQVIETVDGLPYIGEVAEGQFAATGFAGNGMTFGTLAGMMFRDAITGAKNPWKELFSPTRKKLAAAWDYLRENQDYPYYLAKGFVEKAEKGAVETLRCGEGRILKVDGKRVAAFRGDDGQCHVVSPICPHMGCVVRWNDAERTWDCPCHGSRFAGDGTLISGPAEVGLAKG